MNQQQTEFSKLGADAQISWVAKVREEHGTQLPSKDAFKYAENEYLAFVNAVDASIKSLKSELQSSGIVIYAVESAMAIIAAIHGKLSMREISKLWHNEDYIDFLDEMRQYAELSAKIAFVCAEQNIEFPGVYLYEVDMELGQFIASQIIADTYSTETIKAKLTDLIDEFFSQIPKDEDPLALTKVKEIVAIVVESGHSFQ